MTVASSYGVFSNSITMEVIYCYLKSFGIPYEYSLLL